MNFTRGFARKFADSDHLMSKGKIVYSSTPEQLWEDQEAKHLYLGVCEGSAEKHEAAAKPLLAPEWRISRSRVFHCSN